MKTTTTTRRACAFSHSPSSRRGHLVCSMQFVCTAQFKQTTSSHSQRRTGGGQAPASGALVYMLFFKSHLTYSRWTSSLPSYLSSLTIFPSLPGSRLAIFYRDASSAFLHLVNQWLNFTYSRSHAFRCGRKNTKPTLVRIELTTSALAGVQVTF